LTGIAGFPTVFWLLSLARASTRPRIHAAPLLAQARGVLAAEWLGANPMDWMPRTRALLVVPTLAVVSTFSSSAARAADPSEDPPLRVARLIRDLGSGDYVRRQAANDQLTGLGSMSRAALEQALEDPDVEVRLRARQLLDGLKLDDLWKASMVECRGEGQPASNLLMALARQSGNHVHLGEPYGQFAEQVLDARYEGVSYWEAVDDICARSGNRIRPHYDMHTPGIVVSAGNPPKYPRAYGGPVRAQITGARRVFIEELNYEDRKAEVNQSFQINLQFAWEDRFGIVGYANQPELVEAKTDNQVIVSSAQAPAGGWSATTKGLRQVTASIKLNPVPTSSQSFDIFKVRWGLIAIGETAVLEVDDLESSSVHAQDDLSVRVESLERQAGAKCLVSISVARDLAMPEPHEVVFQEYDVELVDTRGRAYRLQSQTHALSDRGVLLKLSYNGEGADSEPGSIRLHYPRLRARRDLELTFRNVPLPAARPE
jgi:hypothetical protein